jgi:hypothetical protein
VLSHNAKQRKHQSLVNLKEKSNGQEESKEESSEEESNKEESHEEESHEEESGQEEKVTRAFRQRSA